MHKNVSWNKNLAYAVGLITTDGCLSKDGRHIDLTSKDINLLKDFLRGCIDGDGNISIVKHPESQHPQLRLRLASSSLNFLEWIKASITQYWNITGGFISKSYKNTQYLVYSKADSIKLLELIYYIGVKYYLKRKFNYYRDTMGEW